MRRVTRFAALTLLGIVLLFARPVAIVPPADALPFAKSFLLTGNYVVGSVDLAAKNKTNGFATGTISMSGIPASGEVVAAYLYWETISSNLSQATGAKFRGAPITVAKATRMPLTKETSPCWCSDFEHGRSMTVFRADVLRLLPMQKDAQGNPTGKILVNDADLVANNLPLNTVTLPDLGNNNKSPSSAGATLFIVYRDVTQPLTSIVVYDGLYMQPRNTAMTQTIRGFLQSSASHAAKITHIVGSGSPNFTDRLWVNNSLLATNPFQTFPNYSSDREWSSPTYNVTSQLPGTDSNLGFGEQITTKVDHAFGLPNDCLTWAAIIFSTTVQDADADGLIDKLEDVSGLKMPDGTPLPDLHAMGASSQHKDVFIEAGAMQADAGTTYGLGAAQEVDGEGHNHLPTPAVVKLVGDSFKNAPITNLDGSTGIQLHVDLGPNYHLLGPSYTSTDADEYLVPAAQARGGELIKEVACVDTATDKCQFPGYPGTVSWKIGYQVYRDAPVDPNGLELTAAAMDDCEDAGNCSRRRFDQARMSSFHYVLYAHARGKPKEPCITGTTSEQAACRASDPNFHIPSSSSGVSDLPGGDSMVTLGFWGDGFLGSEFMQASTTMHELGHSFRRGHGGEAVTAVDANCKPNYLSSMNYLFQLGGLLDDDGKAHLDYSRGIISLLDETTLGDAVLPLSYHTAWYAPLLPGTLAFNLETPAANRFCNGTKLPNPLPPGWVPYARVNGGSVLDPIDWNGDGTLGTVPQDINFDGSLSGAPGGLAGSNDWSNLRLDQIGSRRNMAGFSNGLDFTGFIDFDAGLDYTGFMDFDNGLDYTGFVDYGSGLDFTGFLDPSSGLDYTGFIDYGNGLDYTGFLDLSGVELDREIASALGNTPAGEFKACVIGGTGIDACPDGTPGPLHKVRLIWKKPNVGTVDHYNVFRVQGVPTPTSIKELVTGVAVLPPTLTVVDPSELTNGEKYTYFVVVHFTDGTKSSPSNFSAVFAVNDAPVAAAAAIWTNEDTTSAPLTLSATDVDSAGPLLFSIVTPPSHGTLSGTLPNVIYTPHLNYFGTDGFTFIANDKKLPWNPSGRDSAPVTVSITVNPVNDIPGFTKGPDQTVNQNAGAQTVPNWATIVFPGPDNSTPAATPAASETPQAVNFIVVSNTNSALFTTQPAISPTGTLTYTPNPNCDGVATITVKIQDNGGTDYGGVDTSGTQTFKITVVKSVKITSAGPADIWFGHKNTGDVGAKFDLKVEVLKNNVVIASGQETCVSLGSASATFNKTKAVLDAINLNDSGLPIPLGAGDALSLRVSIRISTSGSPKSKANATLWYNVPPASGDNAHLHAKVGGAEVKYYLVSPFALKKNDAGSGPVQFVDVYVDKAVNGNAWVLFGTWTISVQ